MASLIVYLAHPGNRYSRCNSAMAERARGLGGISFVDLYAEYPRFEVDIKREQERLLGHDVILLQFPLFWYAMPSLLKEWLDLVLETGFAYGVGGNRLKGKCLMAAITVAGRRDDFSGQGSEQHSIRGFLRPLERTVQVCQMSFLAPYVLYGSLQAPDDGRLDAHVVGFVRLLEAIRDDRFELGLAVEREFLDSGSLTAPLLS